MRWTQFCGFFKKQGKNKNKVLTHVHDQEE